MRFIRVYTRTDTGEVVNVTEQETPFDTAGIKLHAPLDANGVPEFEIEMHELGLALDFEPVCAETGAKCSPSQHLFQRLERVPDTADHSASDLSASPLTRFRAKAGVEHEIPEIMDVPTTLEGMKARMKVQGDLPAKARAWLAFMLPPEQVDAMGIARGLPISVFRALSAMRSRRDPHGGSRVERLTGIAQQRSDAHARARLEARQRQAATSALRGQAKASGE